MGKSAIQLMPGEEIIQESEISGSYKATLWVIFLGSLFLSFTFSWWFLILALGMIGPLIALGEKLILTTNRVIFKKGGSSSEFSINQVEGAGLRGGKLIVTGSGGNSLEISHIINPEGLKNKILEAASKAK